MKRLGLIAAAAGAVFLFAVHQDVGDAQAANSSNTADTYKQLNLFGDVFELVRADYVDEVSDETLVEAQVRVAFVAGGRARPIPKALRIAMRADQPPAGLT